MARTVEASLIRAGAETRILEELDKPPTATLSQGQKTLLKAIAQGREWAKQIIAGEIGSIEEIKDHYKLSHAHVARGLKCLRIPPDVISALVEGRALADLNWIKVRPLARKDWPRAVQGWRRAK